MCLCYLIVYSIGMDRLIRLWNPYVPRYEGFVLLSDFLVSKCFSYIWNLMEFPLSLFLVRGCTDLSGTSGVDRGLGCLWSPALFMTKVMSLWVVVF